MKGRKATCALILLGRQIRFPAKSPQRQQTQKRELTGHSLSRQIKQKKCFDSAKPHYCLLLNPF